MAKSFLGGVKFKLVNNVIRFEKGEDYIAEAETTDIVADLIALATQHKLLIAAWMPTADKTVKASVELAPAQLKKLLEGRNPVICQGAKASYPAPYLALLMPMAAKVAAEKKPAGPDLSRKAVTAPEAEAPNLGRTRK